MNVNGSHYRTIWLKEDDEATICIIDQRHLPFSFVVEELRTVDEVAVAIKDMHVRGAGLIGAAAAYGMYLAYMEAKRSPNFDQSIQDAAQKLVNTRPTAINLAWAVNRMLQVMITQLTTPDDCTIVKEEAIKIANEDAAACKNIGIHGAGLLYELAEQKKGERLQILTHCNAGWLAFVDYGSATAPIYEAFDQGLDLHVWVDETRPRNQGSRLTAWELGAHGIPHTIITDNAGGHLMQHQMVDIVLTGSDRTTYTGDVANKIGTYLKALAAKDNDIPFYVALPSSTFDWQNKDGLAQTPIEVRSEREITHISGMENDRYCEIQITPDSSPVKNYAFDVTPSRLVTGLITERGICPASEIGIKTLFPEFRKEP